MFKAKTPEMQQSPTTQYPQNSNQQQIQPTQYQLIVNQNYPQSPQQVLVRMHLQQNDIKFFHMQSTLTLIFMILNTQLQSQQQSQPIHQQQAVQNVVVRQTPQLQNTTLVFHPQQIQTSSSHQQLVEVR